MWKVIGVIVIVLLIFGGVKTCVDNGHKKAEAILILKQVSPFLAEARTAYDKDDYKASAAAYKNAFNSGWNDGVDLYKYAYSLQQIGSKESEAMMAKAYVELKANYPDNKYTLALTKKEEDAKKAAELKAKINSAAIEAAHSVIEAKLFDPKSASYLSDEIIAKNRYKSETFVMVKSRVRATNALGAYITKWFLTTVGVGDDLQQYNLNNNYALQAFDEEPGTTQIELVKGVLSIF